MAWEEKYICFFKQFLKRWGFRRISIISIQPSIQSQKIPPPNASRKRIVSNCRQQPVTSWGLVEVGTQHRDSSPKIRGSFSTMTSGSSADFWGFASNHLLGFFEEGTIVPSTFLHFLASPPPFPPFELLPTCHFSHLKRETLCWFSSIFQAKVHLPPWECRCNSKGAASASPTNATSWRYPGSTARSASVPVTEVVLPETGN